MTSHSTMPDQPQSETETAVQLFDNWFDPIEAGLRDRAREFLQAMLEAEPDELLDRSRYARRAKRSTGESEEPAGVGTEGTIRGYAAASLIVIDEAARVADELLAQCTPNACGIEWKAGRPLDSSAVTVPTPCVKIPRPAPMSASGGS